MNLSTPSTPGESTDQGQSGLLQPPPRSFASGRRACPPPSLPGALSSSTRATLTPVPIDSIASQSPFSSQQSQSTAPGQLYPPNRVSTSTPHPSLAQPRPLESSAGQHTSYSYSRARSAAGSSCPSGLRRQVSTASGRKSRATSSIWGSEKHHVICAVGEARGVSPSVGLAFVNVTTNEAVLSQICDSQFYVKTVHKIQMYEPSTVLMIRDSTNSKSSLLSVLEEELHGTPIENLDRKYWSETAGLEYIQTLAFKEDIDAIKVAISGSFFATSSFAAAIKYMETMNHLSVMPHSLRIRYQPSENSMMIDMSTIHSLELIQNLHNAKSKDCLFGLLNHTVTPMGSRMMRSNILQPSTQVEHTLMPRYDALEELTMKEDMFFQIRTALKQFKDAEKLLTKLVIVPDQTSIYESEQAINYVLEIKAFVLAVPALHEALGAARSDLLGRIRDICRPELIQPVLHLIEATVNHDVTYMAKALDMRNQRTYAVKSGVHGMLDVARQTYKEGTDDVHQHVEDLNKELNVEAEIRYAQNRKYWLRLKSSDFEGRDLPVVFINRIRKGVYIECQTLVLVQLNNRITDSHNEAVILSDKVVHELLESIRNHVAHLFRVCEGIALLDMISAFGHSVTTRDYVRPELGETLALKAARHPICEAMMPQRFVPNDVYASDHHRFQIITGCNMSGKSTYIRMVSLLQIMAQIGCFVPAEYAAFPVIEQLFVRMSTDDSIAANMSTFSVEMREMAFILRNINSKSLAIIDELGRGTSTRDGLAIALAISEALVQSQSLVWFATHFSQLTKVLGSRPGVLNLHLTTNISESCDAAIPTMTMLYKVNSGPVGDEHYGLNLARVVGFPPRLMQVADDVAKTLKHQIEHRKNNSNSRKVALKRKLLLNLHETLSLMRDSSMDDAAIGSYMKRLQNEFVIRMSEIESGQTPREHVVQEGSENTEVNASLME